MCFLESLIFFLRFYINRVKSGSRYLFHITYEIVALFHGRIIVDGKIRALKISGTYMKFEQFRTDLRAYHAYK